MAEELLGVGFDIHGGGSDLVFPHHENEAAQTRAARGAELAQAVDAQRDDPVHRREDGQVGRQHRPRCTRCSTSTAARRSSCTSISGHYRQPLAFSPTELPDARRASVERIREARGASAPARPARRTWRRSRGRVLRRAGRRLQHARGARGAVRVGARGQPPRRAASATPTCARCSACSALGATLLDSRRRRRRRSTRPRRAARAARAGPRERATSPRPTGCASELRRAGLGDPRRPPTGPRADPAAGP